MMRTQLSRRTLLRGMLGGVAVSIGLPALEVFLNTNQNAYATGTGFPRRFGIFFWGNGILEPGVWVPPDTGAGWTPAELLAPLAPVRDDVTVVSGLNVYTPNVVPHGSGPAGLLSGAGLVIRGDHNTFAGPSLDQIIAEQIGGDTRFRSLEFGAAPGGGLSYNGPDSQNPPEVTPYALFERVFGAGFRAPGETTEVDPTLALRRSILDAVMDDATRLQGRLGANDRARLEQHLDGVRDLELRLARLQEDPPQLAACMRPGEPLTSYPDIDGRPQLAAANRAMCDILAMALACDQTRVFSNWFSSPVNNLLFDGASAGHHQLTHDEPGDQPQVYAITTAIMHEFAYLVQALKNVQEGDGTLLDSCVVLGTSDVSTARSHSLDDYPVLLAGTAQGYFQKGVHYRAPGGDNASKIGLSLIRSMGISLPEFGSDEGRVSESLTAVEV